MKFFRIKKVISLLLLMLVCSCSGSQNREKSQRENEDISLETYISVNRALVEREQEKIKEYLDEKELDMQQTGTGLWYQVNEQGHGPKVKKGQVVTLDYQIRLMDGTVCYDSDELGPKEFLVGRGGVESGLEEGVLLLKEGSKASFIMPPHLAHGLVGDDDRIPSRAIILYEVDVVDVKER